MFLRMRPIRTLNGENSIFIHHQHWACVVSCYVSFTPEKENIFYDLGDERENFMLLLIMNPPPGIHMCVDERVQFLCLKVKQMFREINFEYFWVCWWQT